METTREHVQALLGILPDFRNDGQTTTSSPKTASLDDEEEPSSMYKPSGMTASAEVSKCAAALEEAKSIKLDLCLEGARQVLDILNSRDPSRLFAELSTVQIDHPDRVDPQWIMYIMEHLASVERSPAKQSPAKQSSERLPPDARRNTKRLTPSQNKPWRPAGGGFASKTVDVFRVSWLYLKFVLSSGGGSKNEYLLEMMKIAVYGKSLTAYKTAVRLGYASISPAEEITGDYEIAAIIFANEKGVENLDPLPPNMKSVLEKSAENQSRLSERGHNRAGLAFLSINAATVANSSDAGVLRDGTDAVQALLDSEGLQQLTVALQHYNLNRTPTASPFSGDGFTVPHEFKDTNTSFAEKFVIIKEKGPFVYAGKHMSADETGQWMLMKKYSNEDTSDDSKVLIWMEVNKYSIPTFVSGLFRISEEEGTKILTHSPRYVCSFVSCGGFGKVFRIQTTTAGTTEKTTFAVKLFDRGYNRDEELASVNEIARVLDSNAGEIHALFGDGFENAFCALHQDSSDAIVVKNWLNSIGSKSHCIVLKTLAYDDATFCKKVGAEKMHEYVQKLIKCCSYFFRYHPGTIYTDWKPENMIWNDKEVMLVDLALNSLHTSEYLPLKFMNEYLTKLNAESQHFVELNVGPEEVVQNGPHMREIIKPYLLPAQSVIILHQACTVFKTDYSTVFDQTGDLLGRLKELVLQSLLIDPDSKQPLGSTEISDQLLAIVNAEAGYASGGGSLATSEREGRSKIIMSLSGFGALVLASLLPR